MQLVVQKHLIRVCMYTKIKFLLKVLSMCVSQFYNLITDQTKKANGKENFTTSI